MVVRHDEYDALARRQVRHIEKLYGTRGSILDRRGRPLALTRSLPSVAVDPAMVRPEVREPLARRLAGILGLDVAFVRNQLARSCRFRWLRRQIRDPEVARRVVRIGHPAIIIREECSRTCPARSVGVHLVGLTNVDGKGVSGAEQAFDEILSGRPGKRVVLRDGKVRSRRICLPVGEAGASKKRGEDVVLSMDLTIQTFTEAALDRAIAEWTPESATAIVLDPRNGDVLAMASRPTFDPRDRSAAQKGAFRNRAVSDTFEIGSTMKPLLAAAALDRGRVSFADVFDCTSNGAFRIGPRVLHDHKPLGVLRFPEVIIKSSNIGAAQVALRLGVDHAFRQVRALGFGQSTGCGLPGEEGGKVFPRSEWNETWVLPSVAMGHDITVTPLQFATAFATLADEGILHRPRVALWLGDREVEPEPLRQVISPEVGRGLMVPTLVRVVTEGTGKRARIPGYRVGGKTGTAQIRVRGETVGYVSSFVGFAPAEDPRFLALVIMSRPSMSGGTPYGGSCAAPAVGEILELCLRYALVPPQERVEAQAALIGPPAEAAPPAPAVRPTGLDLDRLQLELRRRLEAGGN
jgi:cell division protein FtsI (penicillin-binding protein 3)